MTICRLVVLAWFVCFLGSTSYAFVDNFGVELEAGSEAKTDVLAETLADYYDYYKNNLFFKVLEREEEVSLGVKVENGVKDYVDDKLDNRFHLLTLNYTKRLSKLLFFDYGFKAGPVVAENNHENSYEFYKMEPKFIMKWDTLELSSSVMWQDKSYSNSDAIDTCAINFGIKKQFNQESSIALDFGTKSVEQSISDIQTQRKSQYAKIGYYWQR